MEFGIEKCAMLIMKNRKRQITQGIELPNLETSKRLEKRKLTSIWGFLKQTPSNKHI